MKKALRAALDKNGNRCHLCGHMILNGRPLGFPRSEWKMISPTRDHIVPKSIGGLGKRDNIKPAHLYCNNSRRNYPIELHRMYVMFRRRYPHARGLSDRDESRDKIFFDTIKKWCIPIGDNDASQYETTAGEDQR
jgi:HNH endonuclease